jgi:polyhydroxyalkanoate synthesis repressor PhaR
MLTTRNSLPVLVKRYANRRLYDTAGERYVTVEQLRAWAADGIVIEVIDTETGADITRVLLA